MGSFNLVTRSTGRRGRANSFSLGEKGLAVWDMLWNVRRLLKLFLLAYFSN